MTIAELEAENAELTEQNRQIKAAIEVVNSAVSNMKSGEDAAYSYDWIINNANTYWNVEGNNTAASAKEAMITGLTKLQNTFKTGGTFYTSVDGVIGDAKKIIADNEEKIRTNIAEIERLQPIEEQAEEDAKDRDKGIERTKETK